MSKDILTIGEVRAAGYCVRGSKRWCAINGVDFKQLTRGGIPVADLEGFDDVIIQDILRKKRERDDGR